MNEALPINAHAGVVQQEGMRMRLNTSRKDNPPKKSEEKSKGLLNSKISSTEAVLMLMFGGTMDLIGLIPFVGVATSFCSGGIIFLWQHTRGLNQARPWFLKYTPGIGAAAGAIPGLPAQTGTILFILVANTSLAQSSLQKFFPK